MVSVGFSITVEEGCSGRDIGGERLLARKVYE